MVICRSVSRCRPPLPSISLWSTPAAAAPHHPTLARLRSPPIDLSLDLSDGHQGGGRLTQEKKQRLISTFPVSVKVFQEAGSAEPWKGGRPLIISFLSSPFFAPAASLRSNDDLQESRDIFGLTWNSTIKTQVCSNWRYFLVNTRRLHQNFQHQHPQS